MKLAVSPRTIVGKKTELLRREGYVPAVAYGRDVEGSILLSVEKKEFLKAYREVEKALPLTLVSDDKKEYFVLVHDIAVHAVTSEVLNIDFLIVDPNKKAQSEVPLHLVGEAPVQKNNLGRIQLLRDSVEVSALPKDLPKEIVIDISAITEVHHVIHISDLVVDGKYEIIEDGDIAVLTVVELSEEEPEEVVEEAVEPVAPVAK